MAQLTKDDIKDDLIQLRVTSQYKKELERLAKAKGVRLTTYVNFLIQTGLEKSRAK